MPELIEKEKLLRYLLDILDCETNLIEYENIINQKKNIINRLCRPKQISKPKFFSPQKPEKPEDPENFRRT